MSDGSPSRLVSVITPTFNMGDRLERCIASVHAQTYAHVEHVIVDGGSTDTTLEVLARASGLKWISEPDRGQSHAINKGLKLASGDVLGWLNADDELTPTAIERVVAAIDTASGVGLVYGDIEHVVRGMSRRLRPSGKFSLDALRAGNCVSQPGTFWTRWAQDLVGDLDESFNLTMDYEYWLRFAKAGIRAAYVPEVLARFEVHDASKTGTQTELAFALEEARALSKHGEHHGAAMAVDGWYWRAVVRQVGEAALDGRRSEASGLARDALARMHPVRSRTRWYLWAATCSPRFAARLYRRRQRRVWPPP